MLPASAILENCCFSEFSGRMEYIFQVKMRRAKNCFKNIAKYAVKHGTLPKNCEYF